MPSCAGVGCRSGARCEPDGRCRPVPCAEGFACPEHTRCTSSALADANGCEQIACDEPGGVECAPPAVCTSELPRMAVTGRGCALVPCQDPRHPGCETNTRCRPELESPNAFGCTRIACRSDEDCDCGACLVHAGTGEGSCYDHVGVCVASYTMTCPPVAGTP